MKTVLIVEDDEMSRAIAQEVLGKKYAVNVATNGQECLDYLKVYRPDLILMDVIMPVLNGIDACTKIKADPTLKEIPVVFTTTSATPENIKTGLDAGATAYITKPFTPERLEEVVTKIFLN